MLQQEASADFNSGLFGTTSKMQMQTQQWLLSGVPKTQDSSLLAFNVAAERRAWQQSTTASFAAL